MVARVEVVFIAVTRAVVVFITWARGVVIFSAGLRVVVVFIVIRLLRPLNLVTMSLLIKLVMIHST